VSEHLERRHTLDAKTDTYIGKFDFLRRGGRDLVGNKCVSVSECVGHQVIISHLEERGHSCRLVVLSRCPAAD